MMKHRYLLILLLLFVIPIVLSETESPVGSFTVGNTAPPIPNGWSPTDSHNKSQNFSWSEGTDDNGDPISTFVCISADADDDSCDVVQTLGVDNPSYSFYQNESNWDFTWGTASRNYFVKLTPFDDTTNGTANSSMAFTLSDALPTITSATSDASSAGDKDVGESIVFSMSSHGDTDASDSHSLYVCVSDSISTNGTCTAGSFCNEHNTTFSTDADLACSYTALQSNPSSNTAYFFVCDCPPSDNSCPGQCSSSSSHNFYVNHAPNASSVNITPAAATSADILRCNYTFGDSDANSEGTSTFVWYNFSASAWEITGLTTQTIAASSTNSDEIWMCQITPVDEYDLAGTSVNSSNITLSNSPPNVPTIFSVQDSATTWDSSSPDTHDKTPNLNWTTSDPDNDSITTYVCIATSSGNRDSNNCDAYSATSTNDSVQEVSGLSHSGSSRTYYIRLTPNDGSENGSSLDSQFDLLNNVPNLPTSLSGNDTHDQTGTLTWFANDPDDGSVDKWPADSLTYHIRVGTSYGDSTYLTSDSADNDSTGLTSAIPWSSPGAAWANSTAYISIWTTDGNTDGTSNYLNTTYNLYDNLPDITDISLSDVGSSYSSCTSSTCAINPVEGTNSTFATQITATDSDDDCDSNGSAIIYLCLDNSSCSPSTSDYSWSVDSISRSGSTCTYSFSSNKSASDSTIEFFRIPSANYQLYVNVSSEAGQRTSDGERTDNWEYGTLKAINYPAAVTLGDGSPTLGTWNNGTSLATMTNQGNDNLNIQWSATNPTSGGDTWTLNNTDFAIDDDTNIGDDGSSGPITYAYLNGTDVTFEPDTGLEICSSASCDNASLNDTLSTYFHINPPLGLEAGTYNSTLTITIS